MAAGDSRLADIAVSSTNPFPVEITDATLTAVKTADQSVTNSTTVVNDDALFVNIEANKNYAFRIVAPVEDSADDSGFRFDITSPASPTSIHYYGTIFNKAAASPFSPAESPGTASGDDLTFVAGTVLINTNKAQLIVEGTIRNGANAGALRFRFACQTAAGAGKSCTVKAGAMMVARKVA